MTRSRSAFLVTTECSLRVFARDARRGSRGADGTILSQLSARYHRGGETSLNQSLFVVA